MAARATVVVRLVCYLLFRLLLPITLLAAAVVRYNAVSFIYAMFLLVCPLLSVPTSLTIRGSTGIFLRLVFIVSLLAVLAHAVFHITLAAIATDAEPYGSMFQNCSSNDRIARQIAVERLDDVPTVDIIRLVLPDLAVFLTGLIIYIVCIKLLPLEPKQTESQLPTVVQKDKSGSTVEDIVQFLGISVLILLLAASGIIVPSVISAVYFLTFIFITTLWSLYGRLGRKFCVCRIFLLIFSACHILVLHLYQFQFFQDALSPESFVARLLGLTAVVYTDCSMPQSVFFYNASQWPYFVNPAILLLLYYKLAFDARHQCHSKECLGDATDGTEPIESGRKKRKGTERQVAASMDESQKERLVDSEVRDYSTMGDPSQGDRSGSPTMLAEEPADQTDSSQPAAKTEENKKRHPFITLVIFFMRQSYVASLFAMMAWSIIFHSWLTFVLLLAACIIWMIPRSRRICYILSPIILFYGVCLLLIQFVYGLNLNDTELPIQLGVRLADIGLKKFTYPCLPLALQVLFTLMFWTMMRQYMRERRLNVLAEGEKYQLEPISTSPPSTPMSLSEMMTNREYIRLQKLRDWAEYDSGQYAWCLLCKYWIFVCTAMLLVISLQEVVVYRIIYMILFLLFVLSFQRMNLRKCFNWMKLFLQPFLQHELSNLVDLIKFNFIVIALVSETSEYVQYSYAFWRLTMFVYWWVIIIYSMIVLITLYTFQFEIVSDLWLNATGLSSDTLADIGLETFDTATLFVKLLTPTSFLIFIIIQVHYFHKPFLLISDLDRYKNGEVPTPGVTEPNTDDTATVSECPKEKGKIGFKKRFSETFRLVWAFSSTTWAVVSRYLWRIAEIHVFKLVAFVIIMVCVHEVSVISAVYVILLAVFLPLTGCQMLLSHIAQFWTALVLLSKMIFQLGLIEKYNNHWLSNCTGNVSQIPPFDQEIDNAIWVGLEKDSHISKYLTNYIGILLIIVLQRVVQLHQLQYFNTPGINRPKTGIIFPDITRVEADKGLLECAKYLFNYFFYKFGLELCYVMSAITICVRVDVFAVIYALLMGILLALSRRWNGRLWPIYTILLLILLPIQYLATLGLPLGFCQLYPWDDGTIVSELTMELERWLYLPDYRFGPHATLLMADFFQLLFVCLQWRVFRVEKKRENETDVPDGGSNEEILPEVEAMKKIPVEDFTAHISSYLDVLKNFVFTYMFWVTMAIIFIAGTTRINLFSMGYVIAVFCFMWFGQEFLIKPLRQLCRAWNFLIGYCYLVLLIKAGMQLAGCVYIRVLVDNTCWLVQLLGLTCLRPAPNYPDTSGTCTVEDDNTGLVWDVVTFTFLLLQRRIYCSHYFRHVVADFEAQSRLASRGCQLINRILMREVARQKQEEKEILRNIKEKMNDLKAKQSKLKKNFIEPEEHFQAIRSGDYYLFEETDEEDEVPDEGPEKVTSITFGRDKEGEEEAGPSPLQLISTAVTSGTDEAVKKADEAEGDEAPKTPEQSCDVPAEEEKEEEGGVVNKVKGVCMFVVALLCSCADWLTRLFNKISRNYRLVAAKLKDDHIRVKEQIQMEHRQQQEFKEMEMSAKSEGQKSKEDEGQSKPEDQLMEVSVQDGASNLGPKPASIEIIPIQGDMSLSAVDLDKFDEDEAEFEKSQPRVYRLLVATFYAFLARSELVCYFLMILNHIMSASLLSLPLPMFVFLWGMLSVPRPTKTFWVTVITYTEAIVVVKYLFQFGFFPWNDIVPENDPYWAPRIIGIEQKDQFAAMDLALLLALFIHRTILKRYGLWRDEEQSTQTTPVMSSKTSSASINVDETEEEKVGSPSMSMEEGQAGELEEKPAKPSLLSEVFSPFSNFYKQLTCPDYAATTDVYAPMFLCDFINFLILVFGYQSFGPSQTAGGGDVTSYISEDKVPVPFLIMLLAQFILIVIDRALYLRKNVMGKLIFQIVLVVVLHMWLFFILPKVTNIPFTQNKTAQVFYFVKCVYFALSAYQIRSAYPTRILGNMLTKKYNYVNLILFKGFLAIPFLLELRTLMDWTWTNSTMSVGSWLQMEDIYANIYVLKCFRVIEKNHPTPRAQPKSALIKYGVGGLLLFVVIFILWFPLVIFSFANTVYIPNPPKECTISVAIAGYEPLFKVSGQQQNIVTYNDGMFKSLKSVFEKNAAATAFFSNYEAEDITKTILDGKSTSLWSISPPSRKRLIEDLENGNITTTLEFYITYTRAPHSQAGEMLSQQYSKELTTDERIKTAEMVKGSRNISVEISNVFPTYMRLGSKLASTATSLLGTGTEDFSDISIYLASQTTNSSSEVYYWWEIKDLATADGFISIINFNDRVAPAGFSVITGYGIVGLYVSLVLVIGRLVRVFFSGSSYRILYEELPYVDRLMSVCLNIYMARECQDYLLEEQLFSKLLFAYRSPETMIRFTKMKVKRD